MSFPWAFFVKVCSIKVRRGKKEGKKWDEAFLALSCTIDVRQANEKVARVVIVLCHREDRSKIVRYVKYQKLSTELEANLKFMAFQQLYPLCWKKLQRISLFLPLALSKHAISEKMLKFSLLLPHSQPSHVMLRCNVLRADFFFLHIKWRRLRFTILKSKARDEKTKRKSKKQANKSTQSCDDVALMQEIC